MVNQRCHKCSENVKKKDIKYPLRNFSHKLRFKRFGCFWRRRQSCFVFFIIIFLGVFCFVYYYYFFNIYKILSLPKLVLIRRVLFLSLDKKTSSRELCFVDIILNFDILEYILSWLMTWLNICLVTWKCKAKEYACRTFLPFFSTIKLIIYLTC